MGWAEQRKCVPEKWDERVWKWGRVQCGEWMKRSTLRWFGHIERMENEEFVKKVYRSSVEGPTKRGRPLGRWDDKVMEYVSEMGAKGNELE